MLEQIEFLVGGTWSGTGTLAKVGEFTQEDTYEWTLDGKFIRCRTRVNFPEQDFSFESESLFCKHPDRDELAYWYFCSDGSYSWASGIADKGCVTFEGHSRGMGPQESVFRLERTGEDSIRLVYDAVRDGDLVRMLELNQTRRK